MIGSSPFEYLANMVMNSVSHCQTLLSVSASSMYSATKPVPGLAKLMLSAARSQAL